MQNYVACGEDEGNVIKGKYVAKPVKYYLNVYKFDDKNGGYTLLAKWIYFQPVYTGCFLGGVCHDRLLLFFYL